jgi:serine/threonine-protein kinase
VADENTSNNASGYTSGSKVCTTCSRRYGDDALFCPRDGSALIPASAAGLGGRDPFVGREILGHIEIRALIGSGAMGRVYRAFQRGIDRDVAVKILHKDLAQNPDLVARFLREAKVASRLSHPNVVQVLLAGQLDDGTMYLVMEFLDGISLHSALLAAGGALPLTRALHVGLQICDAVGQAHEAGVVHRDVKPENVMLIKRGDDLDFVKVLDFGIARLAGGDPGRSGHETQAGLVFGTARYLSPEGARGEPVGPMSDCYAIATLLYQAIVGRTPFESDSSVSLLVAQIHDPAPPLRSHPRGAAVPPAVEAAIMRNLAKDPRARDADAHAFGRALLDAAAGAGLSVEELLPRPAVARTRKGGSSPGSHPAIALGTPVLSATGALTPAPPNLLASTQTALAPTPVDPLYHPSYSGRPPERRVAKTVDEDGDPAAFAPTLGAASAGGVGAATIAIPAPEGLARLGREASEDPIDVAGVPRSSRLPAVILILVLIVAAAGGIGAYRAGLIGPKKVETRTTEIESLLSRATAAFDARRWDAPPGENVLELTDRLLILSPAEPRIFKIRNDASNAIFREALDRKAHDDYASALGLLRLAARLSPPDKGLQEETEEVEAHLAKDPKTAGLVSDGGPARFSAAVAIGGDELVRPGDATSLVATVSGEAPRAVDPKAHFTITGPGLDKPKEIDARGESATRYVASFVFPLAGSFKVHFFARPDGIPVVAESVRVVGGTTAPVPPPKPPPKGSAAPSGTWPTKPTGGWPTKPVGSAPPQGTIVLTPDPGPPIPMPPPAPAVDGERVVPLPPRP